MRHFIDFKKAANELSEILPPGYPKRKSIRSPETQIPPEAKMEIHPKHEVIQVENRIKITSGYFFFLMLLPDETRYILPI